MRKAQHGTANEYTNHGCRCDECRVAWNEYYREYVKGVCPSCGGIVSNRYQSILCAPCYQETIVHADHGTESYYLKHRCRCDLCREASAAARRRRRERVAA